MNPIAKKILITLGFLLIYRVLAYVPVPGVNIDVIKEFFSGHQNDALGLLNMFNRQRGKPYEYYCTWGNAVYYRFYYYGASGGYISKTRRNEKRLSRFPKIYANREIFPMS